MLSRLLVFASVTALLALAANSGVAEVSGIGDSLYGGVICTHARTEEAACTQVVGHEYTCTNTYDILEEGNPGEKWDHGLILDGENEPLISEVCNAMLENGCSHKETTVPWSGCTHHTPDGF